MDVSRLASLRCRVVSPFGELDLVTAAAFRHSLDGGDAGFAPAVPRLVVDLTAVTFMDVSPLHELCAVRLRSHERAGWVRLVYASRAIDRLLWGTRLTGRFPRYATVADARAGRVADDAHEYVAVLPRHRR